MELLFLGMELEAAAIPYFVVGQHFGSLCPGMQLPWYNERSIRVPRTYFDEALEVIHHVRTYYSPTFENLAIKSKFRIFLEALVFGWIIPAGNKKLTNPALIRNDAKNNAAPDIHEKNQ